MKTSAIIADKLSNAELVLNIDGGGGTLNEKTGAPEFFTWQGAEKSYADFQLTVTNPGGHSSEPRKINAIDELAAALLRIHDYQFKPELSELTRASLRQHAAKYEDAADRRRHARLRRRSGRRPGDRHAHRQSGHRRQDRHHLRRDDDQRRPCVERPAAAGDRQHQLPHLPRPSSRQAIMAELQTRRGRPGDPASRT